MPSIRCGRYRAAYACADLSMPTTKEWPASASPRTTTSSWVHPLTSPSGGVLPLSVLPSWTQTITHWLVDRYIDYNQTKYRVRIQAPVHLTTAPIHHPLWQLLLHFVASRCTFCGCLRSVSERWKSPQSCSDSVCCNLIQSQPLKSELPPFLPRLSCCTRIRCSCSANWSKASSATYQYSL